MSEQKTPAVAVPQEGWKSKLGYAVAIILALAWIIANMYIGNNKSTEQVETKTITSDNHAALSGITIKPGVEIPLEQDGKILIKNGQVSGFQPIK